MRRRSGTCTGRQSKADPQSTRTQTAAVLLLEHRGSSCRIDVVRRTRIIQITNLPSAERFRPKANDFFRGRIPPYRLHGWRRSLWMGKNKFVRGVEALRSAKISFSEAPGLRWAEL